VRECTEMTKYGFRISKLSLVTVVFLAMAPHGGHAQQATKSSVAGKALAQRYCIECHAVVPGTKGGWTDAPDFSAIANRPQTTPAKLSLFIQQPHMHMLNTGRPAREADQISAYIISLRQR